jgi:hypothetical protein
VTHPTTIRYVGLDVHKSSIIIAVADGERGPATILSTIPNDFASLRQALHRLGTPARSIPTVKRKSEISRYSFSSS